MRPLDIDHGEIPYSDIVRDLDNFSEATTIRSKQIIKQECEQKE